MVWPLFIVLNSMNQMKTKAYKFERKLTGCQLLQWETTLLLDGKISAYLALFFCLLLINESSRSIRDGFYLAGWLTSGNCV